MFTKNWYNALACNFIGRSIPSGIRTTDGSIYDALSSPTVQLWYQLCMDHLVRTIGLTTSYTSSGVIFGNGDTSPTKEDYKLSGSVISGISITPVGVSSDSDTGVSRAITITITNTSTTEKTIKEIGLIGRHYYGSNTNYVRYILIERTVLDTPVTIPAGGVGQVTYTINYPT